MGIINIHRILDEVRLLGCSDLHFTNAIAPVVRLNGTLRTMRSQYPEMDEEEILDIVNQMTNEQQRKKVTQRIDVDFSYVTRAGYRHRCNIFYQRDHLAIAIRLLRNDIPTLDDLFMPPIMAEFAMRPRGLVLITGPTGSGKSTTLAGMIDYVNCNKSAHVITIEDPIEYVHEHKRCMVNQREVGADVPSFAMSLRAALREDPDVILVGEMRDFETISIAITAAETGHLVFSTLHTNDAPSAITRLIDMGVQPFMVASSVRATMAQRLVRRVCKNCAEPVEATEKEIRMLGLDDNFLQSATLMQGKGCSVCGGSGYKGRCGIYEIFLLSEDVQELIFRKFPVSTSLS